MAGMPIVSFESHCALAVHDMQLTICRCFGGVVHIRQWGVEIVSNRKRMLKLDRYMPPCSEHHLILHM